MSNLCFSSSQNNVFIDYFLWILKFNLLFSFCYHAVRLRVTNFPKKCFAPSPAPTLH